MEINNFINEINKLGIDINKNQLNQLEQYYQLLVEWNKKINLTGITEKKEVYLKHFYDSACLFKSINLYEVESLCDVGTGAGFPGLVLKILFPSLKVTLVDALNKRINFLNEVINKLELKDVFTIHSRSEDYAKKNREKFDVVTARAVAPLYKLIEYCVPMVKVNYYFIPMKANISQEIIEAKKAMKELNIIEEKTSEFELPNNEGHRTIIKFKKIKPNMIKYPRKNAEIEKKPLK